MKEELKNRTREWMELERKTLEQREKAESYYERELMDLIVEDYIDRNSDLVFEAVSYMIISVGTSYEPVVLNIKLLNPIKILFLYTENSAKTLDKIVKICALEPNEYDKAKVNAVDPLDIYREIKKAYLEWGRPGKVYIDFTGGTKAMSAAAALAGALIDVQLIYVGTSDYLVDFRKPNPGSEELIYIDNPMAVFGDMEIQKAMTLFEKMNFQDAQKQLDDLKERLPDPELRSQLEFAYLLARAYEAWDALDFVPAHYYMKILNARLQRDRIYHNYLLMNERSKLMSQEKILSILAVIPELLEEKRNVEILKNREVVHALMFSFYQNARTRERQEKYDMATLLFYRLLELIEQQRLSCYDLYVSNMDYLNMKPDLKRTPEFKGAKPREKLELLKSKVIETRGLLFQRNTNEYLAEQVTLLEGFIVLTALKDPLMGDDDKKRICILRKIRSKVYLRNNSIFAHGLGPVKQEEYGAFSGFVTEIMKEHCKLEKLDFVSYCENVRWIIPKFSIDERQE